MLAALKQTPRNLLIIKLVNGLLGLLLVLFIVMFFMGGAGERMAAMENGQRIIVNVATGEMEGKMHQLFPDTTPQPVPEVTPEELSSETPMEQTEIPSDEASQMEEQATDVPATTEVDPYAQFVAELEQGDTAGGETSTSDNAEDDAPSLGRKKIVKKPVPIFPRTVASLTDANQMLLEQSGFGPLPKKGPNGETPAEYYARADSTPDDVPQIALAITGLGSNHKLGSVALELPVTTSLIFSPYAPDAATWLQSARNRGQETWLQLAVEPMNYPASDPGPIALLSELSGEDIQKRLQQNLAKLQAYSGVLFPANERFTRTGSRMQLVLGDLRERGLLALITNSETARDWNERFGDVVMPVQTHIAPPYTETSLKNTLKAIQLKAMNDKRVIVTVEPSPLAMKLLKEWVAGLQAEGIALVPLTAMAK